jgi:hypothetical protein
MFGWTIFMMQKKNIKTLFFLSMLSYFYNRKGKNYYEEFGLSVFITNACYIFSGRQINT